MMPSMLKTVFMLLLVGVSQAFTTPTPENRVAQMASKFSVPPKVSAAVIGTMVTLGQPLIALAEEDYEYGAVDAPIGLAVGGGLLAILTALLPLALQGGEEAFEEMRVRDNLNDGEKKDVLKSRRK